MKNIINEILLVIFRLLPSRMRLLVCSLAYQAAAGRGDEDGAKELLVSYDQIRDQINLCVTAKEKGVHPKHRITRYHDFFTDRIRPGERVLDVGCGIGVVAYDIALSGASVTGIDLSEKNIAEAKEKYSHENLVFAVGDATKALPAGGFDTVVLSNVLEHIEHRPEFLRRIRDVAKPTKWLIRIPMLNRDWLVLMKKELGLPYFSDPTHFTEYTRETFEDEMKAAGLKIMSIECIWGEIWAEARNA